MHYSNCLYTQDQQLFRMIHIQQSVIWDRQMTLFLMIISKSLITWLAFPPYWIKILTTSALPATVPWCKALIPNLFTSFTDAPNSENNCSICFHWHLRFRKNVRNLKCACSNITSIADLFYSFTSAWRMELTWQVCRCQVYWTPFPELLVYSRYNYSLTLRWKIKKTKVAQTSSTTDLTLNPFIIDKLFIAFITKQWNGYLRGS